jgi:hypothetical protein
MVMMMMMIITKVTLVITGASVTISKSISQYLSNLTGKRTSATEIRHTEHYAHTAGSANALVQIVQHGK